MPTTNVLLIGHGQLVDATARALTAGGAVVTHRPEPRDTEIREALDLQIDHVVVISRNDHVALRWALVVTYVRPDVPILVTIFDRHVAAELRETAKNVRVLSMAEIVAPALAGPCLDADLMSLVRRGDDVAGVGVVDGRPERTAPRWRATGRAYRALANAEALFRPFDASARILVYGLFGFVAVLVAETAVMTALEGVPPAEAFYLAVKIVVTVGPSPYTDRAGAGLQIASAIGMLLALGFAAVLTAGLVNRLLDPRLNGIVGRAAVPRRDHVIVVGLGQVGHRLCELFRDLDVPVVVVEQNPDSTNVARAKEHRLPIVTGDGADHRTLRRLSVRNARALVAVTSDDVENIAVAVAARRLCHDLQIALRTGDGDAASVTRSLFGIGMVRDVYRVAGSALAAAVLGYDVREAFPHQATMYLVGEAGDIEPLVLG